MNSQDFLILNVVGAVAFIGWYLVARGGPQRPTKLNLSARDSAPPVIPPERSPSLGEERPMTKNLNVMFNYNGHSWDAYEVLGVPAGASVKIVTEAYQNAIKSCDQTSIEFLETAYKAILGK